jgi:type IV secretion system protein VirB9
MSKHTIRILATWLAGCTVVCVAAQQPDPRLREVWYDPAAVVTVLVKRGVVTHIVLDDHESITEVGAGLGSDCTKVDASWCVAAQPGGHNIFVKPKSFASASNNLAVVTNMRSHAFRFVVLADQDARSPVYRLSVKAPVLRIAAPALARQDRHRPALTGAAQLASDEELIVERMEATPAVVNSEYSIAEGIASADIIPTLIFDDGRFTYLRFPNNREVPAIFHVQADGSESLVNTRMEGDLLVVDRVSRRLILRSGSAVVGVWNEAFDQDGVPPTAGTTVTGVARTLKAESGSGSHRPLSGVKP